MLWCLHFLYGELTPEVLQVVTKDLESQLKQVQEYKITLKEIEQKLAEAK
jgi:ABC-type transporter Mla MlaB component